MHEKQWKCNAHIHVRQMFISLKWTKQIWNISRVPISSYGGPIKEPLNTPQEKWLKAQFLCLSKHRWKWWWLKSCCLQDFCLVLPKSCCFIWYINILTAYYIVRSLWNANTSSVSWSLSHQNDYTAFKYKIR
jgi:hypothetical protein